MLKVICSLYICMFTSCAPLNNYIEDSVKDDPTSLGEQGETFDLENENFQDEVLLYTRTDKINNKISNNEDINIRLRLTIQYFYYVTEDDNGKAHVHLYEPIALDDIMDDIEYAEDMYKSLNIKFTITSISYIMKKYDVDNDSDLTSEVIRHIVFNDYTDNIGFLLYSNQHKDSMSVFYTVSIGNGISGLSTFPWNRDSYGIQIDRISSDKYVLAHEVGHYFGLYHTFQEPTDFVDDTPYKNITMDKVGTKEDPNYNNVMSYPDSGTENLILTEGQTSRVKRFLITHRDSHVILEEDNDYDLTLGPSKGEGRRLFLEYCKNSFVDELIKLETLKMNEEEREDEDTDIVVPEDKKKIEDLNFFLDITEKCDSP